MKAINIRWDVSDGAEEMTQEEMNEILESLPTEIEIPDGMVDMDEISDYISDFTGFCHYGFSLLITQEEYVSAVNENMALEMFEELFEDVDGMEIIDIDKVDESELPDEFKED